MLKYITFLHQGHWVLWFDGSSDHPAKISSSYRGRPQELHWQAGDRLTETSGWISWPDLMDPVASDGSDNWSKDVGLHWNFQNLSSGANNFQFYKYQFIIKLTEQV